METNNTSKPSRCSIRLQKQSLSKKTFNAYDKAVSKLSQSKFSESSNETSTSKLRCSMRLQKQNLFKKTSKDELSSQHSMLLRSQNNKSNQTKSLFKPNSNDIINSSYSPRQIEGQSLKKTTVNKPSQSSMTLKSRHSSKENAAKKLSSRTKKEHKNKLPKICKKSSSSSKKQNSNDLHKFKRKCLSFSEEIPIDDLVLIAGPKQRKVKSEGFKLSGKKNIKRKISVAAAIKKCDEDYEDDIYESKKFDQFQDLIMDTSDSERISEVSTPKFLVTPLIRGRTPKYKDCFSPSQYAIKRKTALEYIYRNKNRKSHPQPETPVTTIKKKINYDEALDEVNKLQNAIKSLAEEESDSDSYFSSD